MLGPRGAVQTDDIDPHAFEDGDGGVNIRAKQHASGGIERDLRLDRQIDSGLIKGCMDAPDRGFDFKDILRGLDEQHIHPAADQTDSLFAENLGEVIEGDI